MKTKILIFLIFTFAFVHSAEAAETQIFYDDFESGIENWDLESGWSVILENGNRVLAGTQHTFATANLGGIANKLELKLKLQNGSIHLNIRSKFVAGGLDRYFIGFHEGGSNIQKQLGNNFYYLKNGKEISLNQWHEIKIEIIQDKISVFSDGNLVVFTQDEDLIEEGGISFETLEESIAYIDDVRVETLRPEIKEIRSRNLFPQGEHRGDIILSGQDFLILENRKFTQFGNIYLKDGAKLIIKNSELKISRYQRLLNHWGIELENRASLEILNSKLTTSGGDTLFIILARDFSTVKMENSPNKIHLFQLYDKAKAEVRNSEIIGDIGGLVGAYDQAVVKVINSKIGAVNLFIPENAIFEASRLGTGFFKDWNLQRDTKVSGINYNIILQDTELIPDRIGPGPFERGWPVFIESSAKVRIKDSQLRKVVIWLNNEKAEFSNFYLEKPADFNYRDIYLENVKVMGQWGIFLRGSSDVVVRDSDAFWTFIFDDSKLTLINTHMNEFDPRNFRGKIIFENSRWDTAAEIVGGQGFFMGGSNDFSMEGSLEIGDIGGFSWQDSKVERVYEVIGKPNVELILTKDNQTVWSGVTDEAGKARFSLKFDDNNFNDSWDLKDNLGHKVDVSFFSKTPIDMEESFFSEFIREMRLKGPPSAFLKLLIPVIFIVFVLIILRKILIYRKNKQKNIGK